MFPSNILRLIFFLICVILFFKKCVVLLAINTNSLSIEMHDCMKKKTKPVYNIHQQKNCSDFFFFLNKIQRNETLSFERLELIEPLVLLNLMFITQGHCLCFICEREK